MRFRPAGVIALVVTGLALVALVVIALGDGDHAPAAAPGPAQTFNAALHDELIAMYERYRSGHGGGPDLEGDDERTERLKEIISEYGWPTYTLVGEDGGTAAWTIAQQSDLDTPFQEKSLILLREAVAAGQASPGQLAALEDRVAVVKGEPQPYGTELRCSPNGPEPTGPIARDAGLDARRAAAGLQPMAVYRRAFGELCARGGA
jgi:hypothetical protein